MCALIIGGDRVNALTKVLENLGITKTNHWNARNKSGTCKKTIPQETECIIMLTSFLNHSVMKYFKNEAKKRNLPVICSRHSASCLAKEYMKIMGSTECINCTGCTTK